MLQRSLVSKSPLLSPYGIGVSVVVLVLVAGGLGYQRLRSQALNSAQSAAATPSAPESLTVTALGRLEPQGEVIQLSAPTGNSGNRVEQLLVQEGDQVKPGQVVAILDSHDRLQAAYEQAQAEVRVAQANLAITQAGAKQGEIQAQAAEIERLAAQQQGDIQAQAATVDRFKAELQNAEAELARYQALYQAGAISASELDSKSLVLDTTQRQVQEAQAILTRLESTRPAQLSQAQANLNRIAEVRPVDLQARQAEVSRANAALKQAQANLDQAYVRVPVRETAPLGVTLEVLDIHTHAGEVVSSEGIVELGNTQRMYAIAQVYESDIQTVKIGQRAHVSSNSLTGDLVGTVVQIDAQVKRQTVVNTDPSANIDGRVIEVHIALDDASSQRAAKFTNLQVTVEIEP